MMTAIEKALRQSFVLIALLAMLTTARPGDGPF